MGLRREAGVGSPFITCLRHRAGAKDWFIGSKVIDALRSRDPVLLNFTLHVHHGGPSATVKPN